MLGKKIFLLVCIAVLCHNTSSQQASLAGLYNSSTNKAWITQNPCLSVINEPDMKVVEFTLSISGVRDFIPIVVEGECLTEAAKSYLGYLRYGDRVYFSDVRAIKNGLIVNPAGFSIRISQYPDYSLMPPKVYFGIRSDTIYSNDPCLKISYSSCTKDSETWVWDFGDGATDTIEIEPTHCYETLGTYSLTLTVSNKNGSSSEIKQITVLDKKPVSLFSCDRPTVLTGTAIQFKDESNNLPSEYLWDFGDGQSSTLKDPIHSYNKAGKYTVSLTTENTAGSNTKVITNYIAVFDEIINQPCLHEPSVGNSEYPTVQIGNQCWLKRDLREDHNSESKSVRNKMFHYKYDKKKHSLNGVYYPWSTVSPNNLCPLGWRIPTEDDIDELAEYLGGYQELNYKLMTEDGKWDLKKEKQLNESGFSLHPLGYFHNVQRSIPVQRADGYFWLMNGKVLKITEEGAQIEVAEKNAKYPVRCIKR